MRASFTMLSAAVIAVGVALVQAAPVLITAMSPPLSLLELPPATGALYPHREDRLDARTALDKLTNVVLDRSSSLRTFHNEASLKSVIDNETHETSAPIGSSQTPKPHHDWLPEELEPFHATPAAESARQAPEALKATSATLEAQPSLMLHSAPQRQVSLRDSASQPSSPAHEGDDHGKHALLDALSPKLLSIKEPALGDIPGKHVTNSRTTSAHAETSHSERTAEAETGHADASYKGEVSHVPFTEKEQREIETLRRARRQLDDYYFKMREKVTMTSKLEWIPAAKKEQLATDKWDKAIKTYQVLASGMTAEQIKAAEQRERFWRRYWSNRLKSHNDIDPDYLRIYARREHPMRMLLFAHTYRPREAQSGHQGEASRRY